MQEVIPEGHGTVLLQVMPMEEAPREGAGDNLEAGANNGTVFLLDVFSGTTGVAASFIQPGGEALGLDHVVDKKRVRGPLSKVDFCKDEMQEKF